MQLMDFYYDPEVATMVTEWVQYMSPVPATQELMLQDADAAEEAGDKGRANKLRASAENPYLYPSDEFLAKTSFGRPLETDEAVEEWDSIFLPISQT
jgi:spermidine/putrescine transport system substrate-binding protein